MGFSGSAPDERSSCSLYFCNPSNWGQTAKELIRSQKHDAVVVCETHLLPENSFDMLNYFDQHGLICCSSPAHEAPPVKAAGGISIGIRRKFKVSSYRHLAAKVEQTVGLRERGSAGWSPGPLDFQDIVALHWHLRKVPLLLVGVYLDASIGLRGNNVHKLTTLMALVQQPP